MEEKTKDYTWYENVITDILNSNKVDYEINESGEDSMDIFLKNYDEEKFKYGVKADLEDIPNCDGDGVQMNNPQHIRDIYFFDPDMTFSFYKASHA